ncbi:carbohydrate ABC transporter permease [Roseisalinus antarcticus]|uniref:L-arabinose transport system permease protein AraQ n=1 Tax=Roseisalinus antarcticus TaxID=254357 RepID=A0A1Y5U001_9RHOB|nr:carbohydrate ABC transporter permease [Roseisalinus antarcticus]SLN75021.1 L-arabinose transport system permease protein AraQ [Roseisalinus antarcticus]
MNDVALRRAPALVALYAVLLAYAAITLMPFAWMLITSFKESRDVFRLPPSFVPTMLQGPEPFGNYTRVLTQHDFLLYFRNSFFVSTTAALGQMATCALAGYAFARMELPGKNVIFALILATAFVPTEVTIIPEFLLMRGLGWVDSFLPLIVPSFLVGSFGTFMLREYFASLPGEYGEAARIDGAGPFRIFWRVYLPLARPALISIFVIAFINNWDELLRPLLYLNSPELRTVPLGLMRFVGEFESEWTLLMAGSVASTLPLILIYVLGQKYVLQGFAGGGVKG